MITKALIPAAGHGTRMRPISRLLPKELVPLGSRPALAYVLEEAARAGLRQIGLLVRPQKELIYRYLETLAEDEPELADLEITLIEQGDPTGLADALALARDFMAGEPFALLLPDNVLLSPDHDLRPMLALYAESGQDVFGVLEIGPEHSGHFGASGLIDWRRRPGGGLTIDQLKDKLPGRLEVGAGERVLRTCGRIICHPRLFDYIERLRPEVMGECSEVPIYQRIIAEHGACGWPLPMPLFDVGYPRGYLAANAWLSRRQEAG